MPARMGIFVGLLRFKVTASAKQSSPHHW